MKKLFLIASILLAPAMAHAALSAYWYTDGSLKIPMDDGYPFVTCTTCTITRVWDGNAIKQFSAKGETTGGALYLVNNTGADISQVTATVSSFTCAGGTGWTSAVVSSMNVTNTTTRPTQVFLAHYLPVVGLSDLPYGHSEFNKKYFPPRFRSDGTNTWTSRPDHDKWYPHGLMPMESFAISSFTVHASSSQAVWIDNFVSTSILAGYCTGYVTIKEGVVVSTVIPHIIKVYDFEMPTDYTFPLTGYTDGAMADRRYNGGTVDTAGRMANQQMLRAHGFGSIMGDRASPSTARYPSPEYQKYLTGEAFTSANGYGNARAYGKGHQMYVIGAYNQHTLDPGYSATNATAFCTYMSSWSYNLGSTSYPQLTRAAAYFEDEVSSSTMAGTIETKATWLSTSCVHAGEYINSWVTGAVPTIETFAPHVTMPASWAVFGFDPNDPYPTDPANAYTPTRWQTEVDKYLTLGTTQTWRYNGLNIGSMTCPQIEEEGYACRMAIWVDWLKLCAPSPGAGTCKGGHFYWHTNYWTDENNGGQAQNGWNATRFDGVNWESNVWNKAKNFGYDGFPSTSTQWGHNGFLYTQTDGMFMLPGKDDVYVGSGTSLGFHGPVAVWPLKMTRRGVNDADVMYMASQVNLGLTTATVRSLITQAAWEVPCTDQTDCSYSMDDRSFTQDGNAYTTAIETLYQLLDAQADFCGDTFCNGSETCNNCQADCGTCGALSTTVSVEISGGP